MSTLKLNIPDKHVGYMDPDGKRVGVFLNLKEEDYFAVKAFSWSYSKEFAKSPAHGQAYLSKEFKIDPERQFFKAVHCLTLEDRPDDIVVVDGTWSAKVKTDVIEPLLKQGKLVVKQADYDDAKNVAAGLKANPKVTDLLNRSESEVSIFWTDPSSGVYCKARIDLLGAYNEDYVIGDLKSFGDLHAEKLIGWQVIDKFYHHQMAFYSMAVQHIFGKFPKYHRWIFCEGKPPFAHKVRTCPENLLNTGWQEMNKMLERYKACQEFGTWPAFEDTELELELPEKK